MKIISGVLVLLVTSFFAFLEVLAIIDPAGSKLADDADPFGPPPSWGQHTVYILVILALFYVGIRLLRTRQQPKGYRTQQANQGDGE